MKPTLSNIEKRVQSLETSRPTDGPVIVQVSYKGAPAPDYWQESATQPAPKGVQEIRVHWAMYIHRDGTHSRQPQRDDDDRAGIG